MRRKRMVATSINMLHHNLEIERKHLLEKLKTEMDSENDLSP